MSVNLDNFGFFDYVQGEENDLYEYTSDEYSEIIEGLLGTGILKYTGEALECELSGSNVIMKTGCAFVKGRAGSVKGNKSLPIPAEEAGLNRMDRVVIRLDKSIRAVCADIVKGTPTSETPTPPSLTRTEIIYEIAPYRLQNLGGTYTLLDDRADANACGYIAKSRFEEIMVVGSKNYGTVLPTTENETGRVFFLLDQ